MSTITLISGFAGAGKSTISRLLAQQAARSLHISVDALREMTISGQMQPGLDWTDEGYAQFARARKTALFMAQLYAEAGVQVLIDDVCVPHMFADHYAPMASNPLAKRILLMPSRDALRQRMQQRQAPWDHILPSIVDDVYDYLEPMPKDGWIVLDTSDWSIERTVNEVQAHIRPD